MEEVGGGVNLGDLMKEGEIREESGQGQGQGQGQRQTMRSILRIGSLRDRAVRRTLWEIIQSENKSASLSLEGSNRKQGTACLWKLRVKKKRGEESCHLLQGWGADRSPAVLDSTRHHRQQQEDTSAEGCFRVFVVAESSQQQHHSESEEEEEEEEEANGSMTMWRALKDKLSLACCGASMSWQISERNNGNHGVAPAPVVLHNAEFLDSRNSGMIPSDEQHSPQGVDEGHHQGERRQLVELLEGSLQDELGGSGENMNLAAALAAERELRAEDNQRERERASSMSEEGVRSPFRVSLMSLLEDGKGETVAEEEEEEPSGEGVSSVGMCCVCMVRRKGAAFIPCGHTFCRLCTRELWVGRGCCPLCNRSILEILDIF